MPSQEEYLDNLLKGIETENTETEVTKEPKMTGTEEETAKAPETPEPVEESGIQVDMSDMDDLLQSALDAQKADSSEQETEASQPVAENTAILPEETASMSEDEINRLLQQSQEQSGDAPAQESNDANDDLIKMLENADDEGLSNILDQVTPETAQPEETAEREEDNGKRGKKKKEKKKKEKKLGFFERFKKKSKEEPEAAPDETESAQPAGEEVTSDIPETVPDDLADLSSLKDGMDDTDKTPMEASDNTESVESTENAAENGDAGGLDDDLDALLAGAFPEQSENSTDNASGEPESADVMDILKAAGADIMDEPEQKKEKKGFFAKLLDLFTEEDEEEEEEKKRSYVVPILLAVTVAVVIIAAVVIVGVVFKSFSGSNGMHTGTVTLPNFVGKNIVQVEQDYKDKLKFDITEEYNDQYDEGISTFQGQAAGRPVKEGFTVTLTVSKGKKMATIPDMVKKDGTVAESELKAAGFMVVKRDIWSEDIASGLVVKTQPAAGEP